jgi:outer membrane assembly lipoprotein YfiO
MASLILAFIIILAVSPTGRAQSTQTSELHGGRWIDVTTPTAQNIEMDPALVRIEQLIRNGQYKAAQKADVNWLKLNRGSPNHDRGLYLMAEALYQYGNKIKSFYYLDELLDEHPESPLFYQSLEKQYQIADDYLNGYKRRFLLIPMFGAQDEALEMLYRIQQRSPKSPIAEKCLLRTADYYYASADYDLAEDAYRVYAESYPRSPYTPRVRLREAYSNLAQFRGLKFDASSVIDAKAQLQAIIIRYPELAKEENLPEVIDRIDNTFARKLAVTADFYKRTHEPRAAAYTYEYLVKNYPNTAEAPTAQRQLERLGGMLPAPVAGPTTSPLSSAR